MRFITLFSLAFILGACAYGGGSFQEMPKDPFAYGAAKGYGLLAEYETWRDNDPEAAAIFRKKAEDATAGAVPEPDMPQLLMLGPGEIADMERSRLLLTAARGDLAEMDELNSLLLAEAQVNYDCWLERAAEQAEAAQWCRERLYNALDGIKLQKDRRYDVGFRKDDAVPDQSGMNSVRAVAAAYALHPDWRVHITGYGDEGRIRGNKAALLAMRRALAVRNALAQNGVDIDNITLGAGAKATLCRSCANMVLLPAYMDRPDDGPDIRKLAPQYFGAEDRDL